MITLRQIIYMILDELKISSDDSVFTEDHIKFLVSQFRAYILRRKYARHKGTVPESNGQYICIDLMLDTELKRDVCGTSTYLQSVQKVPYTLFFTTPLIYPTDFMKGEITYVGKTRMKYVGENKYMQNIIYAAHSPEGKLIFKSANSQHKYLQKVRMFGVFEDFNSVSHLSCDDSGNICNEMDIIFPLEPSLIPFLIELTVKELRAPNYSPEDKSNNASDDLSDIASIQAQRNNFKSELNNPTAEDRQEAGGEE